MTHSTDDDERVIAQEEARRDLEADDPVNDLVVKSEEPK